MTDYIQSPLEDWLSFQAPQCDSVFPHRHETGCTYSSMVPNWQRCKAGLYTCPNLLWHLLCRHAEALSFWKSTDGVLLHTKSDGKLFNLSRLRAKTKIRPVIMRDFLFADDTAGGLQHMVDELSHACQDFQLAINLKKTNVFVQSIGEPLTITIHDYNSWTWLTNLPALAEQ